VRGHQDPAQRPMAAMGGRGRGPAAGRPGRGSGDVARPKCSWPVANMPGTGASRFSLRAHPPLLSSPGYSPVRVDSALAVTMHDAPGACSQAQA
jgi:hypothetical protein